LDAWAEEIEDHFAQEERLLLGSMTPAHTERLQRDHATLRTLVVEARRSRDSRDVDSDRILELGEKLRDHIRWEERELFPALEAAISDETMTGIGKETAKMESRRAPRPPPVSS
jgi:hemerythrin